ncbi:NAD(P)-binding protein [Leucogyrophana mollusca]|uniref:NAD(P)-binding protein n=1 Tax=Leucogyrophana mollusca TaxID=85980 RepID=A0ACB8B2U6_9AGAM|nr:NAD(P)-binding protein [Leucogyrophana mollusca]
MAFYPWSVTGTSSGLGRAATEFLLEKGEIVVATLRKPEVLSDLSRKYPAERLLVVELDVTKQADINGAFAKAKETFGRVDIVLNNAGYGIVAEVEGTSESAARAVFDVNFWGAANVTRAAFKFFREENNPMGGRLMQVSSMGAVNSTPGTGYYNASKFALEGLTECLAYEMDPSWNIKITILEPGPFRTKAPVENAVHEPLHPAYTNPSLPTVQWRSMFPNVGQFFNGDPNKFAAAVFKVSSLENPPFRLPLHEKTVAAMKAKGAAFSALAEEFVSWSEDIYLRN